MYLDFSASTPINSKVKTKLLSILDVYGNPSSLHKKGFEAKELITEASDIIAKCLNCEQDELYFTSGSTMSNNQAIQGFLNKHKLSFCHVVTSCMEHEDIYMMLENYPSDLRHYIPCDHDTGLLDLECLDEELSEIEKTSESPILVSIQWANNEMGVIQDMRNISKIVESHENVYLHSDATQLMPYTLPDLKKIPLDMLSCSAQKIGGIKGTGLLYVRNNVHLVPLIYGEQGLIGGTENVFGISCMGEAFKQLDYSQNIELKDKRDYLYNKLSDYGVLVGDLEHRLPNNLCMIFEDVKGEELQGLLSEMDIYVSTGSACSSHSDKPSRTLKAMGYTDEQANSAIRISLSNCYGYDDLDRIAKAIIYFVDKLRTKEMR